jgi:hypothetical protein
MLDLSSPRWKKLPQAYGSAEGIPALLIRHQKVISLNLGIPFAALSVTRAMFTPHHTLRFLTLFTSD